MPSGQLQEGFPLLRQSWSRIGKIERKEIHRLHDELEKKDGVEIYRTAEDLAHEKAEEEGESTDPVNSAGGGTVVPHAWTLWPDGTRQGCAVSTRPIGLAGTGKSSGLAQRQLCDVHGDAPRFVARRHLRSRSPAGSSSK
jgi:hypothetical protein